MLVNVSVLQTDNSIQLQQRIFI